MAKEDYLPHQEALLDEWEENYIAQLAIVEALLGLDPAVVADCTAAVNDHRTSLNTAVAKKAEAKSADDDKNAKKRIAILKIRDVARKCKTSSAYTSAIGKQLGIEGTDVNIDLNTVKPEIPMTNSLIDMIVIEWLKGRMHGVEIYGVKRLQQRDTIINLGEKTASKDDQAGLNIPTSLVWEIIDHDDRSPWEDKRTNISTNPEVRYYKMRYMYKGNPVGLESDIIKVIAEIY